MNLNEVKLLGRLGKDPELKEVNGSKVCNFSLATSERWKDKDGNKQEKTSWHNIAVWGKLAEICAKYLKKGQLCYICGSLETRTQEKNGTKQYYTSVVVKGLKHDVQFGPKNTADSSGSSSNSESASSDDIPTESIKLDDQQFDFDSND